MRKIFHFVPALVLLATPIASGHALAQDAITSDALRAAQEPSGEFQSYKEHQRGVHASAQAFADAYAKSLADSQEAAEHMTLTVDPRIPDVMISHPNSPQIMSKSEAYGTPGDYSWSMHGQQARRTIDCSAPVNDYVDKVAQDNACGRHW